MPGRGPAPKEHHSRARDDYQIEQLTDTGEFVGPDLPDGVLPKGETWNPMTVKWWDALRRFPLLKDEPDFGWAFLMDTALMHHAMWTNGRWEFASEIRLRVAKYGATPEDRMRLKVKVTTPKDPAAPVPADRVAGNVVGIQGRRARITG